MLEWLKILGRVVYDRPMRMRLIGYRPVVMCLIQATDSEKYLFVRPAEKPEALMSPQEGIEAKEQIGEAAARGRKAELGIAENQIHFRRSAWLGSRKIPEQKGERDIQYSLVKMRGKAYYAALIKMPESTTIKCNNAEIAGHEWLDLEQIRERLPTNSERKQELIRSMFKKLLQINSL